MPPSKGIQPHRNLNRSGGQPRYEESKKQRYIQLTSVGWEGIRAIAIERRLSQGELIEQIGRGLIPLYPEESNNWVVNSPVLTSSQNLLN